MENKNNKILDGNKDEDEDKQIYFFYIIILQLHDTLGKWD